MQQWPYENRSYSVFSWGKRQGGTPRESLRLEYSVKVREVVPQIHHCKWKVKQLYSKYVLGAVRHTHSRETVRCMPGCTGATYFLFVSTAAMWVCEGRLYLVTHIPTSPQLLSYQN